MGTTLKATIFIATFMLFTSITHAGDNGKRQCMDVIQAMKFGMQGITASNLVYSVKKAGKTYYMLQVSAYDENRKDEDGEPIMPWRLLERQGESATYCLIGAGHRIERLYDLNGKMKTTEKYGLPGSGHKRCTEESDGVLASLKIRAWANKELGQSYVQHFTSEIGEYDYTFLNNTEGQGGKIPWVLLSTKKGNPNAVCYYDRGDDIAMYPGFKIPPKMDFDVPPIEGISQ